MFSDGSVGIVSPADTSLITATDKAVPAKGVAQTTPVEGGAVSTSSDTQSQTTREAGSATQADSMSSEEAEQLARDLEKAINQLHGTELKFRVRTETSGGAINFTVVDKETGEVLREVPAKSVVGFAERSGGLREGLLVDEPA